jgi:DNA-binding LacI/PurR family transcriptional regulator
LNEANKTRYAAYASAMASAGLPGLPQLDLRGGGSVEENARRLEDFIAAAPAPPSAFVCFNDSQALNLIKTLKVLDLEVPRDVSVCGFDDRETASSSIPSLTTMRYPFEELARTASKMLLEKIDALRPFDFYERLLLKPTLVVRESSAAIS